MSGPLLGCLLRRLGTLFLLLLLLLLLLLFLLLLLVAVVFPRLLLVLLVLLPILLGLLVLSKDVVAKFVSVVNGFPRPAPGALVTNHVVLDLVIRLGEPAIGAEDEFLNVDVDDFLEVAVGVGTVYDGPLGGGVPGRLGAELAAEHLADLSWLTVQRTGQLNGWIHTQ